MEWLLAVPRSAVVGGIQEPLSRSTENIGTAKQLLIDTLTVQTEKALGNPFRQERAKNALIQNTGLTEREFSFSSNRTATYISGAVLRITRPELRQPL